MSSSLQINTQVTDEGYVITANVLPGGTLPTDIFAYVNTGSTTLGEFFGVVSASDIHRLQTWTGVAIPVFGNAYVKTSQANIVVSLQDDVNAVIATLISSVRNLSVAYQAIQSTTQIVQIP